ncbi:MAG: hypothetical protein AB7G28_18190 [Pirellulales bacterium]
MTAKSVSLPTVTLLVVLLVVLRVVSEYGMMNEYGTDPQMAIWYMFLAAKLLFWGITGIVALSLLAVAWQKKRWWRVAASGLILIWIAAISWSSIQYDQARRALIEAAETSTPPERLRELARFDGIQAGYELDNRLASNPNTPPDTLRLLHGRPDQVGTELCLARNPNTSDDILRALAARNDQWAKPITYSLKLNPKYNEVFGDQN